MKNLSRLLFALALVLGLSNVNAQDQDNPWAINLGINAVDFNSGGALTDIPVFDEFVNAEDHYNIVPSLSTISVSRYLGENLSAQLQGSFNQITKYGDLAVDDLNYYGIDANVRYSLAELLNSGKLDPQVGLGGGYTWVGEGPLNDNMAGSIEDLGAGTLNGSLGLTYWFNDNVGFGLETKYKNALVDYIDTHFQHSATLAVKFGGADTDKDGVYDKDDACPEVFGLKAFNGCPDTDGDGIVDSKDSCPQVAGLTEFNGCPDTDGDGFVDSKDDCPAVKGTLKGCPDADGDGVADSKDKCPKEAGPAANDGCPWADTDGDTVTDNVDKCPKVKGTVANGGCPEVVAAPVAVVYEPSQEVINKLNSYAKIILFDTGRSSFKQQTYEVLQNITSILQEYPNSNFTLEGHTDSVGSKSSNQALSEKRANAVKDYLVQNGISSARLTAYGFGEEYPIDSNATKAGRKNNRRTEVKLRN